VLRLRRELTRPPVLAAGCLGAPWALTQWLFPAAGRAPGRRPLAFLLATAGTAVGVWALAIVIRRRTTFEPHGTPTTLVTAGPFRFSRNPMYLALTAATASVALAFGAWPTLLSPLVLALLLDRWIIPREERLLEALFGDDFRDYRRRVRRWL